MKFSAGVERALGGHDSPSRNRLGTSCKLAAIEQAGLDEHHEHPNELPPRRSVRSMRHRMGDGKGNPAAESSFMIGACILPIVG